MHGVYEFYIHISDFTVHVVHFLCVCVVVVSTFSFVCEVGLLHIGKNAFLSSIEIDGICQFPNQTDQIDEFFFATQWNMLRMKSSNKKKSCTDVVQSFQMQFNLYIYVIHHEHIYFRSKSIVVCRTASICWFRCFDRSDKCCIKVDLQNDSRRYKVWGCMCTFPQKILFPTKRPFHI